MQSRTDPLELLLTNLQATIFQEGQSGISGVQNDEMITKMENVPKTTSLLHRL